MKTSRPQAAGGEGEDSPGPALVNRITPSRYMFKYFLFRSLLFTYLLFTFYVPVALVHQNPVHLPPVGLSGLSNCKSCVTPAIF